mgnify:FL=1
MNRNEAKLKRIAPGYYRTADGLYEVVAIPEECAWYWRHVNGQAHDWFGTKRDAVAALRDFLSNK